MKSLIGPKLPKEQKAELGLIPDNVAALSSKHMAFCHSNFTYSMISV